MTISHDAGNGTNATGVTSVTTSITTTLTDDILVLRITSEGASAVSVTSISDVAGLTWHKKQAVALTGGTSGFTPNLNIEMWWAHSAATLTGDNITANFSSTCDCVNLSVDAFNGCTDFNHPFDGNAQALVTQSNQTGVASNADLTPVSANKTDLMLLYHFADGNTSASFNRSPDSSIFTTYHQVQTNTYKTSLLVGWAPFSGSYSAQSIEPLFGGNPYSQAWFVGIAAILNSGNNANAPRRTSNIITA
jgi:hypothetical protein